MNSPGVFADLAAQRACWHPVAFASEVADRPVHADLLGEEPRWPLPEVPELEAGEWAIVAAGPYRWRCDAGRQVENFTDFGHFPWVHPGLLGDPQRPVVPRHEVYTDGHVLRYEIVRPEAPNTEDFPVFANEQAGPPERRSRYELHRP